MLSKIILLFCLIATCHGQTKCHTTSWWVLLPFSRSVLQPFLSQSKEELTFNTSNPLMKYMHEDEHPVYFEFNRQNQCEQSSLPDWLANLTEQTFVEFKLEIPYLIRKEKTVLLKPMVYQNSRLDVSASHLVYGLPASFATMNADFQKNTYTISTKQGSVQAIFEPLTDTLQPVNSPTNTNFSSFVEANQSPWLAFPPLEIPSRTKCASNIYDFNVTARVRPVKMALEILGDIFHSIPSGSYRNLGDQPLGSWQIDVHTTITSTYECP